MKTKFFLAAGLLITALGYCQNDSTVITANQIDSDSNTFIGDDAGVNNSSGTRNVYIGNEAGGNNEEGDFNVIIGSSAGVDYTGSNSVFVGNGAGQYCVTGGGAFFGRFAGRFSDGANNLLIGNYAGRGQSSIIPLSGGNNVFFGNHSGENMTTGYDNIFIGSYTGANMSTGHDNVFIGNNVGSDATKVPPTTSDKLYIDNSNTANPLIYGDFTTAKELKFNAKKVGIGYDTNGAFGSFPTLSFSNAGIYRFFVRGGILAEEVRIRSYANWADYVFADNYKLMPLSEVEQYIAENGHLPNMPSAEEVEEEGLELGNIVKLQQEKIEELTLHLIEQEKRLTAKEKELQQFKEYKKELDELKVQVQELLNK